MNGGLASALGDLTAGRRPDAAALGAAFAAIMDGVAVSDDIKAFLVGMIPHMGDDEAIAIGAETLRARMIGVAAPEAAIDVCGTGGDGAHTLNISTAVALVVAGCGVPVAKHGNRAMSSRSGAADVLEALGVTLTADPVKLAGCLEEAKVAFLFAQNHHPAMRHVAAARREIGKRTIFNLLGPLSNPCGVKRQLVGVFAASAAAPIARALERLGADAYAVVHSRDGLDECSLSAPSDIILRGRTITVTPPELGLAEAPLAAIKGEDAGYNAGKLDALLRGEAGPYRDVVLLNAAVALHHVAGRCANLPEAAAAAAESIDSGAAMRALTRLVALTGGAS